jgi:homoserine dehydrogenase
MTVRIGLVGTGTVGGGCLDILANHKDEFKRYYGVDLQLKRVCSRRSDTARAYGVEDLFTTDFNDVINDPEIDLVIELIGGTTFAHDVVFGALDAGKNVVTANKALIAAYSDEIFGLARTKNVEIAYGASVGGGIPIIGPLKHSLIANGISSVMGIVNGTTNYMLTRMGEDGLSYDDALAEAQAKGFAEADPTADVDGHDAAAKIAILASLAFKSRVGINDVHCEGIRNVSPLDLEAAEDMGYAVKLLALAHRSDAGIDVRVHPTMIPLSHQLAKVNGVDNAIYVTGDAVGETMFFGAGAGSGPAASAVMGDVVEVARHIELGIAPLDDNGCPEKLPLVPMADLLTKYYIRFSVADRSGVLASMATVFANHGVSVRSVIQRGEAAGESVDVVYVTHTAREADIQQVVSEIKQMSNVLTKEPSIIRVEA